MNLKLLLSISSVHLLSRRKQSMVASLGVAFGIALFISLLGFMTGINDLLDGLILRTVPNVTISAEPTNDQRIVDRYSPLSGSYNFVRRIKPRGKLQKIRNGFEILKTVRDDSRVKGAVPRLNSSVFFISGTTEINGLVRGVEIDEEVRLFGLDENIIAGDYRDLLRVPNGIILGKDLANDLNLELGDQVGITASTGANRIMKVVALFQVGVQQIDGTHAYISIQSAQSFSGKPPGYYTEIGVQLHDIDQSYLVSQEYQRRFRTKAIDYLSTNAQIETGSSVRNIISYAVGITLLIVAGFGIYNILNIMIYEKMNDIAILKATGFSRQDINVIFISQALIIGLIGGLLGLLVGFGLSVLISTLPFSTPALPAMTTYPVNFSPSYYLLCMAFSFITTFLAGYFPARKAGSIDPVEIIRSQ